MNKKKIAIAIDGPAAAGKSTVAKIVAQRLSYIYIDTGAMYRALTLKAHRLKINFHKEKPLMELLQQTKIELKQSEEGQLVFMDGKEVTSEIRTEEVTKNVSYVAAHPNIRKEMVNRQQALAQGNGVVMDGRDIGTHVLPNAEVKIFLKATVEERAKRRYEENVQKGFPADLQKLKREIEQRDQLDSERKTAPLIKAEGAIEIDTTSLNINEVAEKILKIAESKKSF
ncbi:(d)CMP kinase [Virgibacillus sp. YIM 98842]|uniref:(d)CMP kinase n=1 Tax=Virgibacillus sp. YIM 98842 TaxID=2663533 RepID=UPI0013D9DA31|nr:(d)CMP kinase [Virgibacillus sp. YIM 98842]